MPAYRSQGYAGEAARGVLEYATNVLGLHRVLAITDVANADSMKLLSRLGFALEGTVRKSENDPPLIRERLTVAPSP
ncbi:MAG: GNAT family N-acetyltransferase [Gemmatimonadota bacterium]